MGRIFKVEAVAVVTAVFLHVTTEGGTLLGSIAHGQGDLRHRRSSSNDPARPQWMRDATRPRTFRALVYNNNRLLAWLRCERMNVSAVNFKHFNLSLVSKEEVFGLSGNVTYASSLGQMDGLGDIMSRLETFQILLSKTAGCLRRLQNRLRNVNVSLDVYIAELMDLCREICQRGTDTDCNGQGTPRHCQGGVKYGLERAASACLHRDHATYGEELFVLSTHLQCLLRRLTSTQPFECTVNGSH